MSEMPLRLGDEGEQTEGLSQMQNKAGYKKGKEGLRENKIHNIVILPWIMRHMIFLVCLLAPPRTDEVTGRTSPANLPFSQDNIAHNSITKQQKNEKMNPQTK